MARLSTSNKHIVDILFTLALFCVFAASSLMVVIIGANVYKNTVLQMDCQFNLGTSLSYIQTKLRQNDENGCIAIEKTDFGSDALVIKNKVGENTYETWIYSYDGKLREILVKENSDISPKSGQPILDISQFNIEIVENNLIKITAIDNDGNSADLLVGQKCYIVTNNSQSPT